MPLDTGVLSFANLDRGSTNPVKVKFMAGFNTSLRHLREGKAKLTGVARSERSIPFLAGYDMAEIAWKANRPTTTVEITAAIDEALALYLNTNHGTELAWDRAKRN